MTEASPTGLPMTDILADGVESRTPALTFRGVSMTFSDGTHALDETTFDVHPGEFVTVVGPSGCGKSTLLRIASGLTHPTTGWVTIDRAGLGYVFQDATLLPWRTVMGNVELLAELEGLSKEETRRRAQENIDLVGLAGHEKKYPRQMSGGMKMRASLARSLVLDPKVFLFDEPFGAVDEITRERLNDEVISLFMRKRFAGLFITHSISEAVFLSTRDPRDERPPRSDHRRVRRALRVPPGRPTCASSRRSVSSAARSPTRSAEPTREHRRRPTYGTSTGGDSDHDHGRLGSRPRCRPGDGRRDRAVRPPLGRNVVSSIVGPLVFLVLFIALWEYFHRDGMRRFFDKPGLPAAVAGDRVRPGLPRLASCASSTSPASPGRRSPRWSGCRSASCSASRSPS